MNLFYEYNKACEKYLGVSYINVISDPEPYLLRLLREYELLSIVESQSFFETLSSNRMLHVINLFLSRDFLFQKLYALFAPNAVDEQSSFEWDLLSLSHDLGYTYESEDFSLDVFSVDDLCAKLKLDSFFCGPDHPALYNNSTYTNYFVYKRNYFGVCDHGIVASLLLQNHYHSSDLENDTLLNLAYVIASHNLFVAKLQTKPIYEQHGLCELIPSNTKFKRLPYNHNKYSFYYMCLCMIDILEPVNAFNFGDTKEQLSLLKGLSYRVDKNSFKITASNACYIEYIANRIYDIAIWMNIKMIIHTPDTIELLINLC